MLVCTLCLTQFWRYNREKAITPAARHAVVDLMVNHKSKAGMARPYIGRHFLRAMPMLSSAPACRSSPAASARQPQHHCGFNRRAACRRPAAECVSTHGQQRYRCRSASTVVAPPLLQPYAAASKRCSRQVRGRPPAPRRIPRSPYLVCRDHHFRAARISPDLIQSSRHAGQQRTNKEWRVPIFAGSPACFRPAASAAGRQAGRCAKGRILLRSHHGGDRPAGQAIRNNA